MCPSEQVPAVRDARERVYVMVSSNRQPPRPPAIRYLDFVQRVRAHRPTELLSALARVSAAESARRIAGGDALHVPLGLHPWVVAAIARESLAVGSEHRTAPVTDRALRRMAHDFLELADDRLADGSPDALEDFLVRLAFEQFVWNEPLFSELSRVLAMLDRVYDDLGLEVLSRDAWTDLLGIPLIDYVAAIGLFVTGVLANEGRFEPSWLNQDNFRRIFDEVPRESVDRAWEMLSTDFEDIRARAASGRHSDSALRRLDWNPLQEKPFVRMPSGEYVAPQAAYVHQRASINALYFAGVSRWGDAFTRDLGAILEHYAGEHLALLKPTVLAHDLEYESGQNAVDWIVVLDDLVLLVESKSARVAVPGRGALKPYVEDVSRDVGYALQQINKTHGFISSGHLAFDFVPKHMPIRGIVVTAEPHHLINSSRIRQHLATAAVPTVVMSIGELEDAVEEELGRPGSLWLDVTDVPLDDAGSVRRILHDRRQAWGAGGRPRNPILDRAWQRLPFKPGQPDDDLE